MMSERSLRVPASGSEDINSGVGRFSQTPDCTYDQKTCFSRICRIEWPRTGYESMIPREYP